MKGVNSSLEMYLSISHWKGMRLISSSLIGSMLITARSQYLV